MFRKNIDLTHFNSTEPQALNNFHGVSPTGDVLSVNQRYFMRNGEPWFPIMGEFHYARFPEEGWEDELLKMKSGGIQIAASYVFWIHHEEEEGFFDWTGQRNLGRFVQLCQRHGLLVWLRIGPWAHGECRNGGFPDWIEKGGFETRCDSQPYLTYVERFFREIHAQVPGMMYKDGGPVVGIQLENEYGHCGGHGGETGNRHMRTLKRLCNEIGLIVPFYTATAWGNAVVVDGETLPVFGGYVEAPWDQHIHEQPASREYLFEGPVPKTSIGTDLQKDDSHGFSFPIENYPYLTAELGGGIQVTQHRRPSLTGDEIEAFILSKLASGVSMIGYYMYHGGTNPKGRLSTLQESKATGMYNDLPELSYDFQAPLREYGQMSDAYHKLRRLHLFLQDFGEELAVSQVHLPDDLPQDADDMESLRYSVRYGSKGGFLFLNNFQRRRRMRDKKNINISIETTAGVVQFPSLDLDDGSRWIFPFHMTLGGVQLKWATAQLLCRIRHGAADSVVFFGDKEKGAAICLQRTGIGSIEGMGAHIRETADEYQITVESPDKEVSIVLKLDNGSCITLLVLNTKEAEQAAKVEIQGSEYLVITDTPFYGSPKGLKLISRQDAATLATYPMLAKNQPDSGTGLITQDTVGLFSQYILQLRLSEETHGVVPLEIYGLRKSLPNGGISVEFELPDVLDTPAEEWFLQIDFAGDKARLMIDGQLEADWFYLGGKWEVALKSFLILKKPLHLRLEIDPLYEDDFIYLDHRPEFQNGTCCRLDGLYMVPVFNRIISV